MDGASADACDLEQLGELGMERVAKFSLKVRHPNFKSGAGRGYIAGLPIVPSY